MGQMHMVHDLRWRIAIIFTLFILLVGQYSIADGKPDMLFFYSRDCDHCQSVKEDFLPEFLKQYGKHFEFKEIDVEVEAYIDSLFALEDRVGVSEEDKDYPAVYFMGSMVEGEIPIRMRLEYVVEAYLANPDSMLAVEREVLSRTPDIVRTKSADSGEPVFAAYFYKHGCKDCGRAEEIIDRLKGIYPFLDVDVFDVGEERGKLLAAALGMKTGMPEERLMSTPILFIGGDYVLSENISRTRLAELVEKYAETGVEAYWRDFGDDDLRSARQHVTAMFKRFTLVAVLLAGLADGINPCAFATILFFVSYLGMVGRKGREILVVGLSFAFAVFLTYFLVGLGFLNIVKHMAHFEIVAKIIFGGTGVLCIVFGIMSIGDYFKAQAGRVSDMSLQLPAFLKKRIHSTIRKKARMESFVIGALAAGFMVSILEFACTGQVYLPAITLVVKQEGFNSLAVLYLFLYNICFILPLLIVFGFVYFGMSSQVIARIMEARVGTVKLGLATVFFVVGCLLIWTVI